MSSVTACRSWTRYGVHSGRCSMLTQPFHPPTLASTPSNQSRWIHTPPLTWYRAQIHPPLRSGSYRIPRARHVTLPVGREFLTTANSVCAIELATFHDRELTEFLEWRVQENLNEKLESLKRGLDYYSLSSSLRTRRSRSS